MKIARLQRYDCDRCGFTYKKHQLRRQRGQQLCESCYDDIRDIIAPNPRFFSPRDNGTSTSPVNEPTVFSISAGTGINFLGQSREYTREGDRNHYFMEIVGNGGPIDISVSPQIVAGTQGDVLSLRGNSNTNTVKIEDSSTVHLTEDYIILGEGDSLTLVYNEGISGIGWGTSLWGSTGYGWGSAASGWVECSRYKGGI